VQQLTIGIDGYNLAMPRGTGIATYGLNLAKTLQSGGHQIVGAFGLHVGSDPSLRETLFFDQFGQVETGRKLIGGRWRRRTQMLRATLDRRLSPLALDVPLTNKVDKDVFADRLPAFALPAESAFPDPPPKRLLYGPA
jgi:hypothetical protein